MVWPLWGLPWDHAWLIPNPSQREEGLSLSIQIRNYNLKSFPYFHPQRQKTQHYFRRQKNQFTWRRELWLAHRGDDSLSFEYENDTLLGSQGILHASYLNMFTDVKYTVAFGNSFVLFRWLWNIILRGCWTFLVFEIKLENECGREFYVAVVLR